MKSHIALAPVSLTKTTTLKMAASHSASATATNAPRTTSRFVLILLGALSCWAA